MMSEFTRDDLRKLAARQEEPCVSIFTPLRVEMPEALHNPVPFKKLLSEAEKQLNAMGHPASKIAKMVQPGRELLADYGFWQQRSLGLAVFLSPYGFYRFRVPLTLPEKLVISNRFYTRPLLPLMHSDGQFHILAFSQNEVRLLQATRHGERRLELKDIPANMADALQYDKLERQVQVHTYTNQEGGSTGVFHTQGAPPDVKKEDVAHFTEILAKRMSDRLRNDPAPLVLAGVEYLHPMFRRHYELSNLAEPGVHGNPETLSDERLRQQAWALVEPTFNQAREAALKKFRESRGANAVSSDPAKVIAASHYGGVDTLFTEMEKEIWGRFDADNNAFEPHEARMDGDLELINEAAVQTILNSGTVYALLREQMPDPSPVAALFRYPS